MSTSRTGFGEVLAEAMKDERDTRRVPVPAIAAGVVVNGTTVLLAGQMHPALRFTFLATQGGSYEPMTVVVGEPQLDELPQVLQAAIASAREAARAVDE